MKDDDAFLRAILAAPQEPASRLAYADWLEQRGDARAAYLRLDPEPSHFIQPAFLERLGLNLAQYASGSAEQAKEVKAWEATKPLRERRAALRARLDGAWTAFVDSLGCAFEPFFFLRSFAAHELPFGEPIGTRGWLVTFASSFVDGASFGQGLIEDLRVLSQLQLDRCYYGAADFPVHPFLCQLDDGTGSLTGSKILAALRAHRFCSRYIPNLNRASIDYPGYHPGHGTGVENDEVHNDFAHQRIFPRETEDEEEEIAESAGTHGVLKKYVAGRKLWYVLLHGVPQQYEDFVGSNYVVLFAVGKSPHGDRLVGVVTHQVCHNLCD